MAIINQQELLQTIKEIQLFLGFYNFYQRFIKNYSRITWPLNRLIRKDQPFYFNAIYRQAFNKLKERLVSAPLLTHFNLKQPSILETNALNGVIASVFSQKQPNGEQYSIIYYLKTIIDAELNYYIHDKEMLAIISSFQHQRIQLEGTPKPVQVVLDYKALEYFIITKALTARQVRQADILSQFNFLITYRLGTINRVDALIRRKQDLDNQIAAKILLRTQILL